MTETFDLIPTESINLADTALEFCKSVQVIEIKSNDQAENATRLFREVNGYIKRLDEERTKVKDPHLKAGREVDAFFKDTTKPLENLKAQLDRAIRAYQKMLEDKRREEQERLNREAEKKRREEEEKARALRAKEEEARRQEEEARRRAQEAKNEEERKAAEAEAEKRRKEAEAAAAKAEIRENKADTIVAPIAQTAIPKAEGISTRKNWKMQITDPIQFVNWAIENHQRSLLMPNEAACNAYAKQIQQAMDLPGARIFNDEKLQSRGI